MTSRPVVSIIVPTFNRLGRLQRCVERVGQHVSTSHELIVVDGGSTDGTRNWLGEQGHLRIILESGREGAVKAFNKGFRAARGAYVMWLNDDAYPLPGSVEAAMELLTRSDLPDLGMVAFYHNWHQPRNQLHRIEHRGESYEMYHVRGYPYANFGLLSNALLRDVGYLDERYYFFAADPDLALKIQIERKLRVLGCPQALVHHDEHHDERKTGDLPTGQRDNDRLFAKWNLPAAASYPDPAPAYRKLIAAVGLSGSRANYARIR